MEDLPDSISENSRINLSRNTPIAFVVGVSGFLGSHVAHQLLNKGIQVIGVDNFSSGKREHIEELSKNSHFHLLTTSIAAPLFASNTLVSLALPRLDYGFFLIDEMSNGENLETGLLNFLYFIQKQAGGVDKSREKIKRKSAKVLVKSPKIVMSSSILLYNSDLNDKEKRLKQAEILFAKFSKENELNARIIRLATLYGPRMHFRISDPLVKLIQQSMADKLEGTGSGTEFVTQAVYVDDAAEVLVKSVLAGSTANKIYDCLRPHPVYIAELKQLLIDPLWFEEKGFKPTLLPEWFSPNLSKTIRELSWHPKTSFQDGLQETVKYFKAHDEIRKEVETEKNSPFEEVKRWSFNNPLFDGEETLGKKGEVVEVNNEDFEQLSREDYREQKRGLGGWLGVLILTGVIIGGLVLPVFQLVYGGVMIKYNLQKSSEELERGEFETAFSHLDAANAGIKEARGLFSSLAIVQRLGIFEKQISGMQQMIDIVDEGVEGIHHATEGTRALFQTTKYLSGEASGDVRPYYEKAQLELDQAEKKLEHVNTGLGREDVRANIPDFLDSRVEDMKLRINHYSELVEKAKAAAFLLPSMTALDGKKSYLVLLQNNLELRAGGGFIGSYAKITFEKGRVADVKVDDIYTIDGQLKDVIEPPIELKNDLGQTRWYLRDSNSEPDFPTSARQAELFYRRETGEVVSGVIALNLSASAKLLDAVGGVDLPEYGESVNGGNLFEKTVTKAEGGFFPGSQAKKNYLTALQSQLFNKIFYLSKQNWPGIIQAVGQSLEQKQMMVYLGDPLLFSYALSENWGGVLPRGSAKVEGTTKDFISIVEANFGANKANYYLERKVNLETIIGKEGDVSHKLVINYKNKSSANVFPGGRYKNRFKIYLPLGSKLNKFLYGEADLTGQAVSFTDYGRTGYSVLLELAPEEQKNVVIEYTLNDKLSFKDNQAVYRLDFIKQSGWLSDSLEWKLNYPLNMFVQNGGENSSRAEQQLNFTSDLSTDRAFQITFTKR